MGPSKYSESVSSISLVTKPHTPTPHSPDWIIAVAPPWPAWLHSWYTHLSLPHSSHPCLLLQPSSQKNDFQCKANYITLLLKTLQWFTISPIKAQFLTMTSKIQNLLSHYFSTFIFHHLPLFTYVPATLGSSLFFVPVLSLVKLLKFSVPQFPHL